MPTLEPMGRDQFRAEVNELRAFLWQLHGAVDAIVEGPFISDDERDDIRAAWKFAAGQFPEIDAWLSEAVPSDETESPGATEPQISFTGNNDGAIQLAAHGLVGASGQTKLKGWRRILHPIGKRLNRRWAERLLGWGSVVLSSLVDASMAGKAAAEFMGILGEVMNNRD